MPERLVTAASAHERGINELKRPGAAGLLSLVVVLADRLAHALLLGDSGHAVLPLVHDASRALGLSALRRQGSD